MNLDVSNVLNERKGITGVGGGGRGAPQLYIAHLILSSLWSSLKPGVEQKSRLISPSWVHRILMEQGQFVSSPWLPQDKSQSALSASPHRAADSHAHLQLTPDSSQSPFNRKLEVVSLLQALIQWVE